MLKTYDILLDIEKELYTSSNLLFSVSRNDFDSVELNFKIKQDDQNVNLTGSTIELAIKKPSGLTVYQACDITNAAEGEASVRLSIQAYIEYGVHMAEIYVRTADQLAVSSPFWYSARTAIMENEAVDSINEWSALQQALFAYDLRPIITDGFPTETPEYIGQLAFDAVNKSVFIANALTADSWQALGTGEGGSGVVLWDYVIDKPAAFPAEAHQHIISDVTGLQAALDGKADIGEGGGLPDAHQHIISDVTGLQGALDAKSDITHNHDTDYADITHNHDLIYSPLEHNHDTEYAPLVHDHDTDYAAIAHDHAIADVTGLQAALNAKADDADLTAKANAADVYTKAEVYNRTEIDQMTMGEGGGSPVIVENNLTSISTTNALSANQGRLLNENKSDITHNHDTAYSAIDHGHNIGEVTGLQDTLNGKAAINHDHPEYLTETESDLLYADIAHNHDAAYAAINHNHDLDYADINHNHDTTYAAINHDHTGVYAPAAHDHTSGDITDFGTAVDGRITTALGAYSPTIPAEYLTETEGNAAYAPIIHNHDAAYADINHNHDADYADINHNHDQFYAYKPTTTAAAPVATPAHIGQINIDTAAKRTYIAEGATNADWRRLAGTNYVDTADNVIKQTILSGLSLWSGTQTAYDQLGTYSPTTLYFITGA